MCHNTAGVFFKIFTRFFCFNWSYSKYKSRGDRGSLGHGVQWDKPCIGNSKKENAIMTLPNKFERNPPSFCFLSKKNLYSFKSGMKKLFFRPWL